MRIKEKYKKVIFLFQKKGIKEVICIVFCWLVNIIQKYYIILAEKYVIYKIKNFSGKNPEETFDFIYKGFYKAFQPMQIKEEFVYLLKIFRDLNPQIILEIGTARGGTLFSFC